MNKHSNVWGTVMQNTTEKQQGFIGDAELIAIVRETQEEIKRCGELNEPKALLAEFALELLRHRILTKVRFARLTDLHRSK